MFGPDSPHTKRLSKIASNLYFSSWDESSVETVHRSNQSRRLNYPNCVEPTVSSVIIATLVIVLTISSSHHIASTVLKYHEKFQLKIILEKSTRTFNDRSELPSWTKSTLDIWEKRNDTIQHEIPLFWYINHNYGPSTYLFFSQCLGLTFIWNDKLGLNEMSMSMYIHSKKSMADSRLFPLSTGTVTSNKVSEFKEVGERTFLEMKVPEIILIERIDLVSQILDGLSVSNKEGLNHRFRAAVILHHPMELALFEYMDKVQLQQDSKSHILLEDYFASKEYRDNIHVRILNGIWNDSNVPVTKHHLAFAKEILRQKFLVGIVERLSESMIHFEKYYGWWRKHNDTDIKANTYCQSLINVKRNGDLEHFASSSDTLLLHNLVMKRNWADIDLYSYAQVIFDEQKTLLKNRIVK